MARREDDAALLGGGDAGCGAAEIAAAAQAYLDKHQCPAVAADQVDLAAAHAEIALDQAQAVRFEMPCRQSFGFMAAP